METHNEKMKRVFASAIAVSGLDEQELRRRITLVRWSDYVLADKVEAGGLWVEQLAEQVLAAEERIREGLNKHLAELFPYVLRAGPASMGRLDDAALEALAHPTLRKVGGTYAMNAGLLLLGPTGIGKSATAARIVRRLLQDEVDKAIATALEQGRMTPIRDVGRIATWTRATDLSTARSQHALGEGEPPLLVAAREARLLVVDDAGWESQRDTAVPEVLSERYDLGRPSIVTSGLTFEQLKERYSEAVVRRILEVGGVKGRLVQLFPAKGEP